MNDRPIFNFDSKGVRDMAKRMIDGARGIWSFEMKRCRQQRSLSQLGYYWAVVLPAVAKGINEAWGDDLDADKAHRFCGDRFLKREVIDRSTGEVKGEFIRHTGELDTAEFAAYLDQIILFAAEFLNTDIPAADRFHAKECAA